MLTILFQSEVQKMNCFTKTCFTAPFTWGDRYSSCRVSTFSHKYQRLELLIICYWSYTYVVFQGFLVFLILYPFFFSCCVICFNSFSDVEDSLMCSIIMGDGLERRQLWHMCGIFSDTRTNFHHGVNRPAVETPRISHCYRRQRFGLPSSGRIFFK